MAILPSPDKPHNERDEKWVWEYIKYAYELLESRKRRIREINGNFNKYVGKKDEKRINSLVKQYGKISATKYTDYKLGHNKINILYGEYLRRELKKVVVTINKEALSEKLEKLSYRIGLSETKPELEKLKKFAGVDITEGAEIPDKGTKEYEEYTNVKSENEIIMQKLLDIQEKKLELKLKLSRNWLYTCLAAETFGMVELLPNGKVDYRLIHPQNAIFEEIEDDFFLEKTPIIGERRLMTYGDICYNFPDLTKEQRTQIKGWLENNTDREIDVSYVDNQFPAIEVITIQWYAVEPFIHKVENTEHGDTVKYVSPGYLSKNNNLKKIQKKATENKLDLINKEITVVYQAHCIANKIIVPGFGPVKPRLYRQNTPTKTYYDYVGMLFNTVNGKRISVYDLIDEFSFLFNQIIFYVRRELNRYKGTVMIYDEGTKPINKSMKDIMHDLTEDGLLLVNSSAEGNYSQTNRDISGLKTITVGGSDMIGQLINLANSIKNMMDIISMIPDDREGNIAASKTATGVTQSVEASKTMTEPMFYFMDRFTERLFMRICERTKYSWGKLRKMDGDIYLGLDSINFINITSNIHFDDYAVYLDFTNKEQEIRQRVLRVAELGVQNRELSTRDYLKIELAETMGEAEKFLTQSLERFEKITQMQQSREFEAREREKQMAIDHENNLDTREHEQEKELLSHEFKLKSGLESQKSRDKSIIQSQKK